MYNTAMNMTRDTSADAVYIYLTKKPVVQTLVVTDSINIDIDAGGQATGIEILDASSHELLIESLGVSIDKDTHHHDALAI